MIQISLGCSLADPLHAAMFAARKRVFVDLLRWDVPVIDDSFEIDAFDGDAATYLIATDRAGRHLGSLRLLPTPEPHILGDLFANLCEFGAPRGPDIFEITRLCLPARSAAVRREVRNRLISAMVDHCLDRGIVSLTGVVAGSFLEQIMVMGWRCEALGRPRTMDGARLGAFRIDLDADTPVRLATTGIHRSAMPAAPARQAAWGG